MPNKKIVQQYLDNNKRLCLLYGSKNIPKSGWISTPKNLETIEKHKGNLGWVLDKSDLVIDVDYRNGGASSYSKLLKDLDITLNRTVNTPGGFHIYLKIPEDSVGIKLRKNLKEYRGIDFLSFGTYCLICSCSKKSGVYAWSDDLFGQFEQNLAPTVIIDILKYENQQEGVLGDFTGLISSSSYTSTRNNVSAMLDKLDASMPNFEWVKVGMALKSWDEQLGFELWEKWSKSGKNYEIGETKKRWSSFSDRENGVSLGTVAHMCKEADFDDDSEKVKSIIGKIEIASEKVLEFDILPEVKDAKLTKINQEKIIKSVKKRYKELSNTLIPAQTLRQMIKPDTNIEKPDWCEKWVYVNSHCGFMNIDTLSLNKTEAFNLENGKHIKTEENGKKQSAVKFVSDFGFIDNVDALTYLPEADMGVIVQSGSRLLNTFNANSMPKPAKNYTDVGLDGINLIKSHIELICNNQENADIFTQWLAHNVQFPGKKILWAPIFQSIQGVGKSFFAELLRACLGCGNVGTVNSAQVVSEFNSWSSGVLVNVLEELRVAGHNRHEAINALKPLITDKIIQINAKGIKQYNTHNTTNYICFTNYKDALPLDFEDRRWWCIFVQIDTLDEMSERINEDINCYFPRLFNSLENHASEVKKWLSEYQISAEFLAMKQAPKSEYKSVMVLNEYAKTEGLVELKELIETGGHNFNEKIISSSDLFSAFMFEYPDVELSNIRKNSMLKKLGYVMLEKRTQIKNKKYRFWSKKIISGEEIKKLLG